MSREQKCSGGEEFVINGPLFDENKLFDGSLQQYIYYKWKALPSNKNLIIEGKTGCSLTSQQLLEKSIQVAIGFKSIGLKANDVVLMFSYNKINTLLCQYGVLLAGATVAPVDFKMKEHELEAYAKIVQPQFFLYENEELSLVKKVFRGAKLVLSNIERDSRNLDETPNIPDFLSMPVNIDDFIPPGTEDPTRDIVFIVSSSGTTGSQKGVGISHRSWIAQLNMLGNLHSPEDPMRLLQVAQHFWISSILTLLLTVTNGMCRILLEEWEANTYLEAIDKYRTEHIYLTPANIILLSKLMNLNKYDLSSVKRITTGASPVYQIHRNLVKTMFPKTLELQQLYGATEFGGYSCLSLFDFSPVSPLPGVQIKIVDSDTGKSLPTNEKGELYVKTPSLFSHYVNNPEGTAEALDSDGWYHTGDIGYFDGEKIHITGRRKEIFKYLGTHISPVDMETIIQQSPDVKDVGVLGIPHLEDLNRPMALVVVKENAKILKEDILRAIEDKLGYSRRLAGGVQFVDAIPRTSTGKIRRVELQKLGEELATKK